MSKLKLRGKDLRKIGFPESPAISVAIAVMEKHYKHSKLPEALALLQALLADPAAYLQHEVLSKIAATLLPTEKEDRSQIDLLQEAVHYNVFGAGQIEKGALHQMDLATRLPVAIAGALMPDAHHGYGLPIGGVLATHNAVIPYGVGVDIGCRMCLSLFDIPAAELSQRTSFYSRVLEAATLFGSGAIFQQPSDHEVLERREFREHALLLTLHERAWKQLGSSGSGNHFVEFGIVDVPLADQIPGVTAGQYLGLLSHSGSRALGANIANHYTKLARQKRMLPQDVANLAWLNLDEEEGIEYWIAMNLAGDYASACHQIIHEKIARQLGRSPVGRVENHHNFAWKEQYEGKEVIVHRKGATPAGKDVLGIIPGSMTAAGYVVKGRGNIASINSAAHGAGRKMSRTLAMSSVTHEALRKVLRANEVTLLGGGLDEAPFAYKDIEEVMSGQRQLVDIVGKFTPKIVKMCGDTPRQWKKRGNHLLEGE